MAPRKRLKRHTKPEPHHSIPPGLEDKPLEFWQDSYFMASASWKAAVRKIQDLREMKDAEIAKLTDENRKLRSQIARTKKLKRTKS